MNGGARVWIAVLASGCSAGPSGLEAACRLGVPQGSGVRSLDDGESLAVILGPQGQYMSVVAIVARGVDPGDDTNVAAPENPVYSVRLEADGAELASRRGKIGLRGRGDGWFELAEVRLVFGRDPPASDAACDVTLDLMDRTGTGCADDATILLAAP